MRIPEEFIALLREKIDMVDVVSEYVRLKRSGHSYVGLCPFHSEKTPSFHVTPSKGFYYCFGCGAGGTIFNFLMEMEQLTFYQAVKMLADKAGIPVPVLEEQLQSGEEARRKSLFSIHELTSKYYNHILMNHDAGMQGLSYFLHRDLTKKTLSQFQLGYAPNGGRLLTDFLMKRGFSEELLVQAGVAQRLESGGLLDRFRNRVMFPVGDMQGRVVGFGARTMGSDEPKYINTRETELFHKGRILFGLAKARQKIRQTGKLILLEGYMDVISFHQFGITNAVAGLGTALTPEQAELIRRVAEEVILIYDGDAAGQKATLRALDVLEVAGVAIRVIELPLGQDPDEWIRSQGAEGFEELVNKGKRALFYKLTQLTHQHPDHLGSGRIAYLQDALDIVAKEESSVEREAVLEWLGKTYNMPLSALRDDLARQIRIKRNNTSVDKAGKRWNTLSRIPLATIEPVQATFEDKRVISERQLLMYMMLDANVARQVQERVSTDFSVPIHAALQAYLYQYYANHDRADPEVFLNQLSDLQMVQFASALLQKANDDGFEALGTEQEIEDYIQCLIGAEVEKSMQEAVEQLKIATEKGDMAAMRSLSLELKKLRDTRQRSEQQSTLSHGFQV